MADPKDAYNVNSNRSSQHNKKQRSGNLSFTSNDKLRQFKKGKQDSKIIEMENEEDEVVGDNNGSILFNGQKQS